MSQTSISMLLQKLNVSISTYVSSYDLTSQYEERIAYSIYKQGVSSVVEGVTPTRMLEIIQNSLTATSEHCISIEQEHLAMCLSNPLTAALLRYATGVTKLLENQQQIESLTTSLAKAKVTDGNRPSRPVNSGIVPAAPVPTTAKSSKKKDQTADVTAETPGVKKASVVIHQLPKPSGVARSELYSQLRKSRTEGLPVVRDCTQSGCMSCSSFFGGVRLTSCTSANCSDPTHTSGWYVHIGKSLHKMFRPAHKKGSRFSPNLTPLKETEMPSLDEFDRVTVVSSPKRKAASYSDVTSKSSKTDSSSWGDQVAEEMDAHDVELPPHDSDLD